MKSTKKISSLSMRSHNAFKNKKFVWSNKTKNSSVNSEKLESSPKTTSCLSESSFNSTDFNEMNYEFSEEELEYFESDTLLESLNSIDYEEEFTSSLTSEKQGTSTENTDKAQERKNILIEEDKISFEEFSFKNYDEMYQKVSIRIEKVKEPYENMTLVFPDPLFCHVPSELQDTQLEISVKEFFDDLIDNVIELIFKKRDEYHISDKLDKRVLLEQLKKVFFDTTAERKVNNFLVKKASSYFYRKNKKSHIEVRKLEPVNDILRYGKICQKLDQLLGLETAVKNKINTKISELRNVVRNYEETKKKKLNNFENLVRKAFKCESRKNLAVVVNLNLEKMSRLRREISHTRSIFIRYQYLGNKLENQVREMKSIDNDVTLTDIERLFNEIREIDKKVEDRNTEIFTMHKRFKRNLHIINHLKLKTENISRHIRSQQYKLFVLTRDTLISRQKLSRSRQKHKRTSNQLKKLRWQSGLLNHPALLHDYDEIMEILEKRRANINKLRKMHAELEEKNKNITETTSSNDEKSTTSINLK